MKTTYIVIGTIFVAYLALVILPNIFERNNYKNCAAESLSNEEAARFTYAGNIRNDKVSPRTCRNGSEMSTFEERNIFSIFQ